MSSTVVSADILLPRKECDLYKFCCVACDQFTGDSEYWQQVENAVGDAPSAYNMIFPEIYLGNDNNERTAEINKTMERYLQNGIFDLYPDSVIYLRRTLANGKIRRGIIAAVDLDAYDYKPGTRSLIRPTEGTVEDRLPPRVNIRRNAPLELPHIMLLINDESKTVIESLDSEQKQLIYETPLMLNGGSIQGFLLEKSAGKKLLDEINALYTGNDGNKITLAVGDGNHSLATAKKCWEEIKPTLTKNERLRHPARYALCEIVNLHDTALAFEPIHRILYNIDRNRFLQMLKDNSSDGGHECTVLFDGKKQTFYLAPTHSLNVGTVQNLIDAFINENGGTVDYIHEPEQVEKNSFEANSIGLLVPGIKKSELFASVIQNGVLPRKTFSMGMGIDKRYYLEARKIK